MRSPLYRLSWKLGPQARGNMTEVLRAFLSGILKSLLHISVMLNKNLNPRSDVGATSSVRVRTLHFHDFTFFHLQEFIDFRNKIIGDFLHLFLAAT
jgi:hypothetical protein